MGRAENTKALENLNERFTGAKFAVCADFRGLTVAQITELRGKLRQDGAHAMVVKNTLAKISCKEVLKDDDQGEVEKFLGLFKGTNFVVFAKENPVISAKTLAKYQKDFEKLEIKGGWLDGRFVDKQAVVDFSNMASKEESLAMLLCLMQTPATQVVQVLSAPARQLVGVLDAWRRKLEEQAA